MLRAFIIILAVVAALISMSMLASRGGHESYDAEYFSPGPVIGILKGLSEDELEGREIGTPGAARAREMITARMSAMEMLSIGAGYEHPFSVPIIPRNQEEAAEERPPLEGVNLIGAVQGSAGSDRIIVITAHYDHVGIRDGEIYNGADDNASGVATALALAQHLSRSRNQPKHTFLFVFPDGEEHGLSGARGFLADPPLPVDTLAFNLNFDMLARADNGQLWASGAHHMPALLPLIEEVAAEAPIDLRSGYDGSDEAQDDWTTQSDHAVFYRNQIPHLYLGVEDHPDYHQPTDDFENIDQDTFLRNVDTAIMVAKALDDQLEELLGLPALDAPTED
ncbi:M28 family peptidase [Ponticaulis sp.]|uniref:M28 family peptidase n=1 Tax=Ponticaulis sp. TaxID=2020902 RepID=UPI00260914E4|nr:M28 family peptidase [Ponticaulis sp.]MDF1680724.1 M20/M25/M40 family metallo-hydrolase [Ponticaulis sp.]